MREWSIGSKYAIERNTKLNLSSPVGCVAGIDYNEDDIKNFNKLGIYTVYDLLTFSREDFKREIYHNAPQQYFAIIGAYINAVENLKRGLPPIKDFLPNNIILNTGLMPLEEVIQCFHSDNCTEEKFSRSEHRLAFNEVFLIQCGLKLIKRESISQGQGITCKRNGALVQKVIDSLPFNLTDDQLKTFETITYDMQNPNPMRWLVQGDVGSGKTVVAMLALVKAVENGYQGAMLAPTEILAVQHYNNFGRFSRQIRYQIRLTQRKSYTLEKS